MTLSVVLLLTWDPAAFNYVHLYIFQLSTSVHLITWKSVFLFMALLHDHVLAKVSCCLEFSLFGRKLNFDLAENPDVVLVDPVGHCCALYFSAIFLAQNSGGSRVVETPFPQVNDVKFHLVGVISPTVPSLHLLVFSLLIVSLLSSISLLPSFFVEVQSTSDALILSQAYLYVPAKSASFWIQQHKNNALYTLPMKQKALWILC